MSEKNVFANHEDSVLGGTVEDTKLHERRLNRRTSIDQVPTRAEIAFSNLSEIPKNKIGSIQCSICKKLGLEQSCCIDAVYYVVTHSEYIPLEYTFTRFATFKEAENMQKMLTLMAKGKKLRKIRRDLNRSMTTKRTPVENVAPPNKKKSAVKNARQEELARALKKIRQIGKDLNRSVTTKRTPVENAAPPNIKERTVKNNARLVQKELTQSGTLPKNPARGALKLGSIHCAICGNSRLKQSCCGVYHVSTQSKYIEPGYAVTTVSSFEGAQEMQLRLKLMADAAKMHLRKMLKNSRRASAPVRKKTEQKNEKRKVISNAQLPNGKMSRKHSQISENREKRHPLTHMSWTQISEKSEKRHPFTHMSWAQNSEKSEKRHPLTYMSWAQNSEKSEKRHPFTHMSWPLQPTTPTAGSISDSSLTPVPLDQPVHQPTSQCAIGSTCPPNNPSLPLNILPHITILKPSLTPHGPLFNGNSLVQEIYGLFE